MSRNAAWFGVAGGNRRFPSREVSSNEIFSGTASAVEKMSDAEYPPSQLTIHLSGRFTPQKRHPMGCLFCCVEKEIG